jgi:hypothetical protein
MITAGKSNITVVLGEDFSFSFTIEVSDVLLDLSDATVISQVREQAHRTSDLIAEFTCLVDDAATPNAAPTANVISLNLTDEETAAIECGEGYYDVLVIDVSGNDTYYLEGKVVFKESVTVKP